MYPFKTTSILSLFSALLLLMLTTEINAQQQQTPQDQPPQQQQEAPQMDGDDVITVLNESPDHTLFAQMVEDAELNETLQQAGPFTIIAPTDEAVSEVEDELNEVRGDPQQLQNLVINHLFQGEASAEEVEETFEIEIEDGDIDAANGIIHSVEDVRLNP